MNNLNSYENLKDWFNKTLGDQANEIAENGADCGFTGIIYTNEMVEIFDYFQDEIWEMVVNEAEEIGENPIKFISSFNRIDMTTEFNNFKALLVWFACEKLAREFDNLDELPF
jgi:hypothetical protein